MINNERTVTRKNRGITISEGFLDRQNAWGNLEKIKILHHFTMLLHEVMEEYPEDRQVLRTCDAFWDLIEYQLQDCWGFERNNSWFKFWDRPGCTCPKMDNDDSYPSGIYNIRGDCPIHGG